MTTEEKCKWSGCNSKYLVNKKYGLCEDHNYARLHNGRTKREVYAERSLLRISQRQVGESKSSDKKGRGIQSKKKHHLKKVSSTTRYRCSDGSLVSQAEIAAHYRACQERITNSRMPICQGTGRKDLPLSFSHTISRARCKALGKTELIWDEANIEIESMGENNSAHYIWEHGNLEKKKTLLNFTRKLAYIKEHDPETYRKYELVWGSSLKRRNGFFFCLL